MKTKPSWHLPDYRAARKRTPAQTETIDLSFNPSDEFKGKSYYISTYGCQANEADSEVLAGLMEQSGMEKADSAEKADLIVINTCAIRENAHNHVLGEIGNYKRLMKNEHPPILAVCGCLVQQEGFVQEVLEKYPWVSLLFGTHNLTNLPQYLARAFGGEKVVEIFSREGEVYEKLPARRASRHKAWVNIMYGCDKFCTYCVVPYTRGKQRSRKSQAILEEVKALKKLGYKEITLLGQNVNAYGKDLDQDLSFADLLEKVAQTGIERIRFMTSHPWDFDERMIEVIARYDNIMPSLHLPLQSGDDEILKRMGRRYTQKEYLDLVEKIKEAIPDIYLSTDVIVGFPDESDEAFEKTLEVMEKVGFDNAYTFIYSPREHTPAAKMEDHIPLEVKKERLERLNTLWNSLAYEKAKKEQGEILEVLVDGPSRKNQKIYSGHSRKGKLVNFSSDKPLEQGDLVQVHIDEAKTFTLNGHALN